MRLSPSPPTWLLHAPCQRLLTALILIFSYGTPSERHKISGTLTCSLSDVGKSKSLRYGAKLEGNYIVVLVNYIKAFFSVPSKRSEDLIKVREGDNFLFAVLVSFIGKTTTLSKAYHRTFTVVITCPTPPQMSIGHFECPLDVFHVHWTHRTY